MTNCVKEEETKGQIIGGRLGVHGGFAGRGRAVQRQGGPFIQDPVNDGGMAKK